MHSHPELKQINFKVQIERSYISTNTAIDVISLDATKAKPAPAQAIKQSRSAKSIFMGYMNQNHADAVPDRSPTKKKKGFGLRK